MKPILFSEFLRDGVNVDSIIVQGDQRIHLNHVNVSDGEVTIHDGHFDFGFIFDDFICGDVDNVEFLITMVDKYGSTVANTIVLKHPYSQYADGVDSTEVYGRSTLEEVDQILDNLIDEQQRLRHEIESFGTRLKLAKQKIEEHLSVDRMVNISTILENNICLRDQIREVVEDQTISLIDLIEGKGTHFLNSVIYDGFGGDVVSAGATSSNTVHVRTNTVNGIYLLEFENEEVGVKLFKPNNITVVRLKPTEASESNNGYDQFAQLYFAWKE